MSVLLFDLCVCPLTPRLIYVQGEKLAGHFMPGCCEEISTAIHAW